MYKLLFGFVAPVILTVGCSSVAKTTESISSSTRSSRQIASSEDCGTPDKIKELTEADFARSAVNYDDCTDEQLTATHNTLDGLLTSSVKKLKEFEAKSEYDVYAKVATDIRNTIAGLKANLALVEIASVKRLKK